MKILICPDKFKGSLSAQNVASCIASGIHSIKSDYEIAIHPLADGGDGSLDLLKNYLELHVVELQTKDPLNRTINTKYYTDHNTAYIEFASSSGFVLLTDKERNPLKTSSLGTGEQIMHAINSGFRNITLFLGGSATNDAGTGILHALGYRFLDTTGKELYPCGENLIHISRIEATNDIRVSETQFLLLCDVDNPLYGPRGAAYVYAPQKGANHEDVLILDEGLRNFAKAVFDYNSMDIQQIEGAGAAGGVPGGLSAFLNARLVRGAEHLINITGLEKKLIQSDVIITGEGCLDNSSLNGKLPYTLFNLATKHDKDIYFIVGHCMLEDYSLIPKDHIYSISSIEPNQELAMSNAADHVRSLSAKLISKI